MKITVLFIGALALGACAVTESVTSLAPEYLQLSPDEQNIWEDLSPAQRDRAVLFITNGATLVSSLGSQ
ncbi:MAG: hypothetical protein GQ535_07465 [Rhodobacteraceae bacterium]|nr:hypothetical protein [Paracoccaceae bacterium]